MCREAFPTAGGERKSLQIFVVSNWQRELHQDCSGEETSRRRLLSTLESVNKYVLLYRNAKNDTNKRNHVLVVENGPGLLVKQKKWMVLVRTSTSCSRSLCLEGGSARKSPRAESLGMSASFARSPSESRVNASVTREFIQERRHTRYNRNNYVKQFL